jgi:thiamine biosynthesis lipoprotein
VNHLKFESLGTHWVIESNGDIPSRIQSWLSKFEKTYSRFIDSSFLNNISRQPGRYELDLDGQNIFRHYQLLYKLTSGLFSPLIGQNLVQSGYDSKYSLNSSSLTDIPLFEDIFEYNPPYLETKKICQIDFGGIGKGYAIEQVKNLLLDTNSDYFYINAGQDIYVHSPTPVEIALENPSNYEEAIGIATISNQSICASSGNRRNWGKFHHIINPQTKSSPVDIIATWVVADNPTVADAISTCIFLLPPQKLASEFNFEYLIIDQNQQATRSPNFPATLF